MPDASGSERVRSRLLSGLDELGVSLDTVEVDQMLAFLDILRKWNKVYNLTAVRDIDTMIGRHILDSLALLAWLPVIGKADRDKVQAITPVYDVIDVGSGAGLPTIPLAIARPGLHFLSVESNGKKTRFQNQAVLELGLPHVQVRQARIENISAQAYTVTSRAFTAPQAFLTIAENLCVADGQVLIMLGQADKMPERLTPPFDVHSIHHVDIPQCESTRHIAICTR